MLDIGNYCSSSNIKVHASHHIVWRVKHFSNIVEIPADIYILAMPVSSAVSSVCMLLARLAGCLTYIRSFGISC